MGTAEQMNKEPQNVEVPEHGNRRTDEQGTLNFEVPERYFLIKHEGTKDTEENPRTVFFFNHALKRSGKIIFRRKIGEAGS